MKINPATRKKFIKKRTFKKGKSRAVVKNKTTVSLGLGFPKRMTMTHKYREVVALTIPVGFMGSYFYSCNGMYDPNITGTGGQPLFYDQMTVLYDHYTVIGSKLKVRFLPQDSTGTTIACGVIINDDSSTATTSYLGMGEQSSSVITYLSPQASKPTVLTKKWSAKKEFGGSILGNTDLQGSLNANPTEQSYFHIFAQHANLSGGSTLWFEVELEYIAIWRELKDVQRS